MKAYSRPRLVAIGGGTGLSTMLRGLKNENFDITSIVTVADNGGGSGVLRQELGMLPPGDIRNCVQALANTPPAVADLLAYRYTDGSLKGQSFGNLLLAALNGMCTSFHEAVALMCEILSVTGRVLPVTDANVQLCADFADGASIRGECEIADYKKSCGASILRATLEPAAPEALPECLDAIRRADLILLGPGSLYTSVIPNLLVRGIPEAIHESDALKLCILNVMTQIGETEGYAASDFVRALFQHGGEGLFDLALANSQPIPPEQLSPYVAEGAEPLRVDEDAITSLGVQTFYAPVASWKTGPIRHDPDALASAIARIYLDRSPTRVYR